MIKKLDDNLTALPTATLDTKELQGEGLDQKQETTWKAAKKFEAFFMGFVFEKGMDSVEKSGDSISSLNKDVYQTFLSQAVSDQIEKSPRGLGLAEMLVRSKGGNSPSLTQDMKPLSAPVLEDPEFYLPAARVTSDYGFRGDPIEGDHRFHKGVDFAYAPRTPILAAADGEVIFSGKKGGYGNTVIIKHDNGYSSLYAHADENIVKVGSKVKKGELLAYSGSTGRSTGPHLHFEIRKDGETVNPEKLLKKGKNT